MKKWTKKLLTLLTMILLVAACLPTTAFATGGVEADETKFQEILDSLINHTYISIKESASDFTSRNHIDKVVYVGDTPEDPDADYYPGVVYYLANYDYEGKGDRIVYSVLYLNETSGFTCNLLTPEELGFTAPGYVASSTQPWTVREDYKYLLDCLNYWSTGTGHVFSYPSDDCTSITFHETDGGVACYLEANWAEKGAPVVVKKEYPTLDKTVNGGDSASVSVPSSSNFWGDEYWADFTLTSNVPADLWKCFDYAGGSGTTSSTAGTTINGAEYTLTFHDEMPSELMMGNPEVYVGTKKLDSKYYTWVRKSNTGDGCTFHIKLDLVKLYQDRIITDSDIEEETDIEVRYSAYLKVGTAAGSYENTAWVSWDKKIVDRQDPNDPVPEDPKPETPEDEDTESEKDTSEVYTSKIQLTKTDKTTGAKLSGAKFVLEVYDAETQEWTQVGEQTTGDDGIVSWDGLIDGTYRLTETEAPTGYIASSKPVEVVLPTDADYYHVARNNFTNGKAPSTGGSGIAIYTIVGLAILGGAAVVFAVSRKKRVGR